MHKLSYEKDTKSELLLLPNLYGFIEECCVHFESVSVHATIETYGRVAFVDEEGKVLAETKVDANTEDGKHSGGFCGIKNDKVCVFLDITGLKDTYPNCDGEHDRWVSTIVGYTSIAFDPITGNITETKVDYL